MALPYYRFFPGDYARDTRHLSMMQNGAYRQLIDEYMVHGPLQNDLQRHYRTCSAFSAEERAAVEYVLAEFFMLDGPRWTHKRCDAERAWQVGKSNGAKESAEKRWNCERNANAMRTHSDGNANQNQIKTGSSSTRGGSSKVSTKAHIVDSGKESPEPPLVGQARLIISHLNLKANRAYRPGPANLRLILARLKEGTTPAECFAVIDHKARDWLYDPEMVRYLRPATLFNALKFAQYLGELPHAQNADVR